MTFSGTRTAAELLALPTNISIVTDDFLKDIGANNLIDALQYSASGVTNRVGWRDDFTMRGFRQAPLRDGTPYQASGFTAFYDVERIEVIKGPTALMFNTYGNISGNVNYVTKRPTSKPSGDFTLTAGNYGNYIASVTQRGPLNPSGTVRYRITGGKETDDGWQGRGTSVNQYNGNDLLSASVDWNLTKKLELRFDGSLKHARHRDLNRNLLDPATMATWSKSASGEFSMAADWSYRKLDERRVALEAVLELTPSVTLRAKVVDFDTVSDYRILNSTGPTLNIAESPNYTRVINVTAESEVYGVHITDSFLDGTWIAEPSGFKSQLSFGVDYTQRNVDDDYYAIRVAPIVIADPISSRPAQPVWTGSDPHFSSRNGGLTGYVQETLTFFKGKLIGAGGVFFVTPSTNSLAKSATVPNYGAVYRLSNHVSAYASYGKSFTPRSGNDIFGTPLVNTIGESREVGVKVNAFNEHLFGTVTYFDITNDPVFRQVQGIDPRTGLLIFGNALVGKELNDGWEIDGGWVQAAGPGECSIYGTAYLGNPRNALGAQPSSAIKRKYTVFIKYEFKSGPLQGFQFGGGRSQVGESPGVGFAKMPGYSLISAYLAYQKGRNRFAVNVNNLADERGVIIGAEGVGFLYLAEPRRVKFSYTRTW